MNIKSQKDFFSGLMFMAVGVAFAWGVLGDKFEISVDVATKAWILVKTNYAVGTGARMGPGYFPLMLGILLAILGLVIMFKALVVEAFGGDKIGAWAWKPLFFIIAANLLFGVLLAGLPKYGIPAMGLIVGIYALVFVASVAEPGWKVKNTFILATVLAAGSYIAFVYVLKLQFPVWPAFLTR